MVKMSAVYQGEKHCELVHGPSGSKIETDAPVDNQGRGERFSPTDLVGAALASCILTTLALVGERDGIDVKGSKADVEKIMASDPRRISEFSVHVTMPKNLSESERRKLEQVAHHCPVARSLHPDLKLKMTFEYA